MALSLMERFHRIYVQVCCNSYITGARDVWDLLHLTILYSEGIATMDTSSYPSNKQKESETVLESEWQVALTSSSSLRRYCKMLLYIQFCLSLAWEREDGCS